ncbi:hypothetical protein BLNAU_414 [Blattamonas nauphoetae]|uniref:Uncharacterized protein n=1 Tax=Blattamonas nauphoetae TaxID=2049346 RepID=A0ABQ9YL66_9EUKA|nr:hypothetical protein BLNAU_414 [Blattamonas nauphoetae]
MVTRGKWEIAPEFPIVSWKSLSLTHVRFIVGTEVDIFGNGGHSILPSYEKMFIQNYLDIKLKLAFQSNLLYQFVPTHIGHPTHAIFNTTLQRQPSFRDVYVILIRTTDGGWNVIDFASSDQINELLPRNGLDPMRSFPGRPKIFPDSFHLIIPEDYPIQLTVKDAPKVLNSFLAHQQKSDQGKPSTGDPSQINLNSPTLYDYLKNTPMKDIQKRFQEAVRIAMRRMNAHQSEMIPYLVLSDTPPDESEANGKPTQPNFRLDCGFIIPMCLSSKTLRAPDTCLALQPISPSPLDGKEEDETGQKPHSLFDVIAILPPDQAFFHASLAGFVDSMWLNQAFSTKLKIDAQLSKERQTGQDV